MLCFNQHNRITAVQALQHAYFADFEESSIEDGEVVVPDDGEGKSVAQIFEMLKEKQAQLRYQREQDERQYTFVDNDIPGL